MVTSTPRRHHLPPTIGQEALLTHSQNSPISMKYSVTCASKMMGMGETVSYPSVVDLQTENRINEEKSIQWTLRLLLAMTFCSALFSIVSLQFYFSNAERLRGVKTSGYRNYIDIIKDIINSFDIAIVSCSIITFFVTSLQLIFLIKIVKQGTASSEAALQYIRTTSFLRIIAYSFWFASILAFVAVILLNCAIDPSRSLASKCVALTLGAAGILLALWFSVKTLHFWAKLSCAHVYRDDCYNYLSTLV